MSDQPTQLPIGTRIRFLKTLTSGPDEHGPGNHYATAGDSGTVAQGQFPCKEGHWVTWDGWKQSPFGATLGSEFEVHPDFLIPDPTSWKLEYEDGADGCLPSGWYLEGMDANGCVIEKNGVRHEYGPYETEAEAAEWRDTHYPPPTQ